MNDRKLRILQAVIHNYILNAEPVGSRTLSKKYDLGVSPATIRNEMSDLEDLGYLVQPHTSAGRIPSDKAYRLYVDYIMKANKISDIARDEIKRSLYSENNQIEQIIQNSARLLSQLTNYTAIAIAPENNSSTIKHIQLVPVDNNKVLLVLVTNTGSVKNKIINIDNEISNDELYVISKLLTDKLKGIRLDDIGNLLSDELSETVPVSNKQLLKVVDSLNHFNEFMNKMKFYTNGVKNIFDFPEYNDISKAKEFISFIEDKDSVIDMLMNEDFKDFSITIGNENCYDEIKNCSLITATYKLNGKTIGKIGVLGPTRMDYSKVIPLIKSVTLDVNEILRKYYLK